MLFGLSERVDDSFLAELREEADVEVDEYNRITKYEKKEGGGFKLSGVHKNPGEYDEGWDDFVIFIAEKSENVTAPFDLEHLCSEFKRESGRANSEGIMMIALREIRPIILKLEEEYPDLEVFDIDTKVKMLFGLSAPVDYDSLERLREDAVVEVDHHLRITKYEKKGGGGLQLSGVHKSRAPQFAYRTNRKALKVLAEIAEDRKIPMKCAEFAKEYEKSADSDEDEYAENSYEYIREYLHIATEYDVPTRIKMLFVTEAKVNPFFLNMIRKDAIVDVDDEGKITKYEAHDGSLTLDINQNATEENSAEQQDKNKKSSETQDDAKVKKDKKKSASDSTPDIQKISNIDITKKENVQKNENGRGADAEKVKKSAQKPTVSAHSNARNETKTDAKKVSKPVETTSIPKIDEKGNKIVSKEKNVPKAKPDAVETLQKLENNKRKAAETNDAKTAKIAKKSMKSTSKNQENEEPQDDDLIYEGGIPPLPIPLVPRKTEEIVDYQEEQVNRFVAYQPTKFGKSQFLPDYHQDNDGKQEEMDTLEAIREASFAPVNTSLPVENQGIEMTNSEDILKLMRALVQSLDSPMVELRESSKKSLQKFSEKIDNAMEKMRVEDHKVPSDEMMTILNASLQIVLKSVPSTSSSEDSASLQLFLWSLRSILIAFSIPALVDFQETINENLRELNGQDKMISIERIRRSLETVLALAIS